MRKYGILAHPAKHSLSPIMHNAAFKALEIDASYEIFDVAADGLSNFIEMARSDLDGFSVSLPYKESIIEYLDEIDEAGIAIGAVNTVVNEQGRLLGYNTDWSGALKALGDVSGKRVALIGAGGSAKAIYYGLVKDGADVSVFNRNADRAVLLAGKNGFGLDELSDDFDILIQSTSIWTLNPDAILEDLLPSGFLSGVDLVMDIVYKPLITPLLKAAQDLGKTVVTGEKMLLYQAALQFKIWTGIESPIEIMKSALDSSLTSHKKPQ